MWSFEGGLRGGGLDGTGRAPGRWSQASLEEDRWSALKGKALLLSSLLDALRQTPTDAAMREA